jgi:5-methylcytosine-specific restriction protein A
VPVTEGHGNPKWTREETILALDLYLRSEGSIPPKTHPAVVELSQLLRSLPYHQAAARNKSFRNPDGVAFKLQNLRQAATGRGLDHTSAMDKRVWEELGHRPADVATLARAIRASIEPANQPEPADPEEEFFEGRTLSLLHRRRERNPKIRQKLLALREQQGSLRCDVCDRGPPAGDARLRDAVFEAHHVVPLGTGDARRTRLDDMALLCASCHRLLHRLSQLERRWIGILEAKRLLGTEVNP